VEIIFIGNEGVYIQADECAVVIDGLFGDGAQVEGFADTPRETLDAVENGTDPFTNVRLILATHYHPDHFDPHSVARHLTRNPDSVFLSTPQCSELLETADGFLAFADRIHIVDPAGGVRETVNLGGVRVDVFGLSHGKVNYADVEHLGLIVHLDGKRIIHLGDGIIHEKSLRLVGVFDETIDVAFLPFWFLTYPFGQRLMSGRFKPEHVFAIHIPVKERDSLSRAIAAFSTEAVPLVLSGTRYQR